MMLSCGRFECSNFSWTIPQKLNISSYRIVEKSILVFHPTDGEYICKCNGFLEIFTYVNVIEVYDFLFEKIVLCGCVLCLVLSVSFIAGEWKLSCRNQGHSELPCNVLSAKQQHIYEHV